MQHLILCSLLFACAFAHLAVIGSIGPGPNSGDFFKADANSPCPVAISDDSRMNVTMGQPFPVTWALIVNHNKPPNPVGNVRIRWAAGVPNGNSNFVDMVPPIPIVNQIVNYYFQQDVVIIQGDSNGRATLQVMYDVNGGKSPFPAYYQCINVWSVMA